MPDMLFPAGPAPDGPLYGTARGDLPFRIPADCAPAAEAIRDWQGHVDAGRIGNHTPLAPDVLANLLRTDALFRSFPRSADRA